MHQSFAVIVLAGLALPALGQSRVLVADRAANAVWIMDDINGNGVIDEPSELWQCFNATNAPATANVDNPNTIAGRGDGLVAVGDQLNQFVLLMRDLNRDGDALDLGESWVAAGPGNAAGVAFAFPTGAAFDAAGVLYVVNAGNAAGADAIYRLVDLTGDGDFQDAGEVQDWVTTGAFGATPNGPFSPQEIAFAGTATQPIGFLRNSSSGLHGVFRFVDLNGNGRADDAGEFTAYWDAANAGGITPSAGFTLEADLAHPGSMYTMQIATGGIDQLIRLTKAFFGSREWYTHSIKKIDDLRSHVGHSFDRRLVGQKVATIDRIVEVLCRRIAFALGVYSSIDAALGTDRVRTFDRYDRDHIDLVSGLGYFHRRREARKPAADDRNL